MRAAVRPTKTCSACGADVSAIKRTKDINGSYYCDPCWNAAHARFTSTSPSAAKPGGLTTTEKRIIVVGIVAGAILLGSVIYFAFLKDRWEQQHRTELLALKADAEDLTQRHRLSEAEAKYEELFKIVGHHPIRDESLESDLLAAHESAGHLHQQIAQEQAAQRQAEQTKRENEERERETRKNEQQRLENERIEVQRLAKQREEAKRQEAARQLAEEKVAEAKAAEEATRWKEFEPAETAAISLSYDKFEDVTRIATKRDSDWELLYMLQGERRYEPFDKGPPLLIDGHRIHFGIYARMSYNFKGKSISERPAFVFFDIYCDSSKSRIFNRIRAGDPIYFIQDGKRLENKVTAAGDNEISVALPIDGAVAISQATTMEVKVGVLQFKYDRPQFAGFRNFLRYIHVIQSNPNGE